MLKIKISDRSLSGGPNVFRENLIKEFSHREDILISNKDFDCELCFISFKRTHNKPVFLRLDGCYTDRKRFGMNKSIVSSIRNSNYQIYQSKFSQKLFNRMLNINTSNSTVVHNGVDVSNFTKTEWKDKEPMSFVSCAIWRLNKRPNSIIEGFLEADIKDSVLYFIGGGRFKKINDPRIKYVGEIKNSEVIRYLKKSRYYINLSQMESCPNSVIEAILCGCKVISGSCGGTKELLNSDDVICNIDPKFNFKQHGEVMDSGLGNVVSGAIKKAINTSFSKIKDRSRYSIKKCTDNYVDFIKSRVLK